MLLPIINPSLKPKTDMDKQPDFLSKLTETNGKSLYLPFQSTASTKAEAQVEEEKWDLGWLVAVARRQAPLIAGVALGTTLLGGGLLHLITILTPPQYVGKFQILVEPITAEELQARSYSRAQGSDVPDGQRINIEQSSLDYDSQIRILAGPKLLEPVVRQVRQRYPNVTYETLIKNFEIKRIMTLSLDKKEQGTKLIEVSYQDTDPEKIKFVLNRLSQTYLNYSLKERQSPIRRGIEFIDSQLRPLRQRVDSLQRQIQSLRQRYFIVDPEQQGKQLTEATRRLDQIASENQTRLAEAEAKRNTLARQLKDASSSSVLGETTYSQPLISQYQQVEGQIAVESARYKPDHPTMKVLLEKRQNLQNLLNREASRVVKNANDSITLAKARLQEINREQAEINQKIRQLPAITRQYSDLQRELTLATDRLNNFATRQETLQIDAAQQEIPWELTIPPRLEQDELGQPLKVNSVSQVRFLALIAVLGMLLGVGVGFLVEITRDLLNNTDEVRRATRLPLLGVIPHDDSLPQLASPPVEAAFRSLSKNIFLLNKTYVQFRSFMISSPDAGDGKSTIALNLAMNLAAMGQRVLLVDADLRHPQIHKLLGLSNQRGFSNLLLGDQDVQKVIQSHPSCENLKVLTSGQSPLDPLELFTTNRVEPLFQKFQAMFDLVIIDAPPLLGLADSSFLADQCDSLTLVVRLGKTNRLSVLSALEELQFSSTNVLGVIANDASKAEALTQSYYKSRPQALIGS
ncbi:MAG: polysaccharide biosynthesis tyrosine autokinase [Kovacikia sp.]